MTETRRKASARGFLDAHARVDAGTMQALLTPKARFHSSKSAHDWAGMPEIIAGAQTIARMMASRHGEFGGPALWRAGSTSWEHLFVIEEDDYVVIHTIRRSITVDGTDYENPYVCIFGFEGELISDVWEYLDSAYSFSIVPRPQETTAAFRGEST